MEVTRSLMIIDDDPEDKELFKTALVEVDPRVKFLTASNGEDALRSLKNMQGSYPDIIFLDLNMPRLNGKQCLAEIKKVSGLDKVPVIMFSTSHHEQDIAETRQLGAAHYLAKPNTFLELKHAISSLLGQFVYRKTGLSAD